MSVVAGYRNPRNYSKKSRQLNVKLCHVSVAAPFESKNKRPGAPGVILMSENGIFLFFNICNILKGNNTKS